MPRDKEKQLLVELGPYLNEFEKGETWMNIHSDSNNSLNNVCVTDVTVNGQ